jgi:hypothetical protein
MRREGDAHVHRHTHIHTHTHTHTERERERERSGEERRTTMIHTLIEGIRVFHKTPQHRSYPGLVDISSS